MTCKHCNDSGYILKNTLCGCITREKGKFNLPKLSQEDKDKLFQNAESARLALNRATNSNSSYKLMNTYDLEYGKAQQNLVINGLAPVLKKKYRTPNTYSGGKAAGG